MDQSEKNFRYLWQQYAEKQASPEELDELFRLLKDPGWNALSQSLLEEYLAQPVGEGEIDVEHWMDKLPAVRERGDRNREGDALIRRIPARRIWIRYAAAAALLVGIAGTYFLLSKKQNTETLATTTSQKSYDITPGGNKAILTLGNGSKIILDSAANGSLAKQGTTDIIKTDSGKLLYSLVGSPLSSNQKGGWGGQYNTLSTPRGGQYQLTLPDGTKVWLDAASSITYPTAFTGKTRGVTVTGQVYFEVVHKTEQPFIVTANNIQITDIGTEFNINAYNDEPQQRITLLEGSVAVKSGADKLLLKPGEQAQNENEKLELKKGVDVSAVMAWKNGQFQLGNISFATLMRQLSRWYDIDIVYEGKIPEKNFGGTMNRSVNLSRILEVLHDYGIETKLEDKKLIIMDKPN
jgi:transmembrane sensor